MDKVTVKVESYVKHLNYGDVFTFRTVLKHTNNAPKDTVNHALKKEVNNNNIIHIRKGIYAKPKMSRFGPLPIGPDKVVKVLAKENRAVIYPSGAFALNALGLTTQIPMTHSYIATKRISSFKHSSGQVSIRYSQALEKAVAIFRGVNKDEKDRAILFWISLEYLGDREANTMHESLKKVFNNLSVKTQEKFIKSLGRKLAWSEKILI